MAVTGWRRRGAAGVRAGMTAVGCVAYETVIVTWFESDWLLPIVTSMYTV